MQGGGKPNRRSIRMAEFDYSQDGMYYLTLCTQDEKYIFGKIENDEMVLNNLGIIARDIWLSLPEKYPNIILDEFIIMPNHLHNYIYRQ